MTRYALVNRYQRFEAGEPEAPVKTKIRLPPIDQNAHNLDEVWKSNPFKFPANSEWVDICLAEKIRSRELRHNEREKKVHDKNTFQTRYTGSTFPSLKKIFKTWDDEMNKEFLQKKPTHISNAFSMTSQKLRVRPVEREFTHELIQRKREMFLVNFALQTKRDQINEYKSRRIAEEYKLKKTAETLQKDAQTFNEFVKANDESAVNAMKASERESRLKLEKITELRRMQTLLGTAKAEISKMDEFLADYLSYKSFLLQVHHNINKKNDEKILTTEQWEARLKNIRKRKAERIKKKKAQEENKRRPSIPARKRQFSISKDAKKSKERMTSPVMSKQLAFTKINYPEEWEEDEIEATKKTERISYLLEDPKFLPNLIRDMEEENLKLILHNQYSEETVDEVKHAYDVTTKKMEKEVKLLRKQVEGLQASIKVTNRRSKSLQIMCHLLDKGVHENGDKALSDLNQKIEEVYMNVFGRLLVTMDGLVMLTSIEKRMQELVDEVESLPKSDVNEVRKNKEKQRRLLLREKKLAMELHRQEERARRALERSNANRFKKVGRKLVYRSEPLKSRETAKVSTDRVTKTESQIFLEKE